MTPFTMQECQVYSAVVAVHGVGNARPGDILLSLTTEISKNERAIYERRDFLINGVIYPRASAPDSSLPDIIEVNWADLQRAKNSLSGLLAHVAKIVIAASRVAIQWGARTKHEEKPHSPLQLLPFLLEGAIPWSTALAIYVMFLVTLGAGHWPVALAVTMTGFVFALWAASTAHLSKPFSRGGSWASILFPILALAVMGLPASTDWWLTVVDHLYAYVQIGSGWFLAIAFLGIAFPYVLGNGWRKPKNALFQILARFALCWTGVVVLSLGTRMLWAICASAVAILAHFGFGSAAWIHWQQLYIENTVVLGRPMATYEFSMYVAMFLIGVAVVLGAAVYAIMRSPLRSNFSGRAARLWLRFVIVIVPFLLLWFGVRDRSALVLTVISRFLPISPQMITGRPGTVNVAPLYVTSMTRILPFLLIAITPAVVMLDVAGDILFYVLRDHPLSIGSEVRRRITDLTKKLDSEPKGGAILIIGHSQGSVAAFDALNEITGTNKPLELVTLGSPITSLYAAFLNWASAARDRDFRWRNCCRPGDYIGGIQNPELDAEEIPYVCLNGPGGHIDYWSDQAVLEAVFTGIETQRQPRAKTAKVT